MDIYEKSAEEGLKNAQNLEEIEFLKRVQNPKKYYRKMDVVFGVLLILLVPLLYWLNVEPMTYVLLLMWGGDLLGRFHDRKRDLETFKRILDRANPEFLKTLPLIK